MNELPDVSAGATWRCVDLHLHTPGIHTFVLPSDANPDTDDGRSAIAARYVDALEQSGVTVGAITDYQGVREPWFSLIRDEAHSRGITILPGAEVSLNFGKGLHLLLICDPDVSGGAITESVRHLHQPGGLLFTDRNSEHTEIQLSATPEDALRRLKSQLKCVVVAAHACDAKGVFTAMKAGAVGKLADDGLIDAIDKCETAGQKIHDSGLRGDHRRRLACTLSSDPKSIEDVGAKLMPDGRQRVTWIKLSRVDAGALLLALHDRETRVLLRPPLQPQHTRILSMTVDGGFLDGLELRFSDDLTTLIGGRGAGKSAILETLRYALDVSAYSDQSEREALVRHALGTGGQVRLVIERPGPQHPQRFAITRVLGQAPRSIDLASGERVDVTPVDLFGEGQSPVILLQREIAAVSRNDEFRRRLLDEIIGDAARQADNQVRRTIDKLRVNRLALEASERRLADDAESAERLARLQNEIAYFEQQGVAEKFERHSKTSADAARVKRSVDSVALGIDVRDDLAEKLVGHLEAAATTLRNAQSEHAGELQNLAEEVVEAARKTAGALGDISSVLQGLSGSLERQAALWPDRRAVLDKELQRIQTQLGVAKLDPKRYVDQVAERTALEPIVAGLKQQEIERKRLLSERALVLAQLQEDRRAAFKLRQSAAKKINKQLGGKLQLTVTYLGDTEEFVSRLTAVLKGSHIGREAIQAMAEAEGVDGVELSRVVAAGADAIVTGWRVSTATAQNLVRWLMEDVARMRKAETLAPEDRVSIALTVDGAPRDLEVLSGGQRATALLLLLFAQGDRPLILDQPEDDLDNRFVYEDVVALLRDEKGTTDPKRRRQIVVATHNANIPVNGDAELVLGLVGTSQGCTVTTRGSIDDEGVRQEIRAVLEGGEEAFRRRAEKYGGIDDTR